jgi:serine/threonine protein kinase
MDPHNILWTEETQPPIQLGPVLGRGAFGVVHLGVVSRTHEAEYMFSGADDEEFIDPIGFEGKEEGPYAGVSLGAVAVKEVAMTAWENICREVVAMIRCSGHPNIVRLLGVQHLRSDLHSPLDRARLVMEFAPGRSLAYVAQQWCAVSADIPLGASALLEDARGMPEVLVRRYARDLLEALAYVHSVGIAHCDVKGANALLMKGGRAALADFGSCVMERVESDVEHEALQMLLPKDMPTPMLTSTSASLSSLPTPSKVVGMKGIARERGTMRWTAPELVSGTSVGREQAPTSVEELQAGDIWSFGCTVLELLSGSPPWWWLATDSGEVLVHIISTDLRMHLPSWLSPPAKEFLCLCLDPAAGSRSSAAALLDHPFLQNLTHLWRTPSLPMQATVDAVVGSAELQKLVASAKAMSSMSRIMCRKGRHEVLTVAKRAMDTTSLTAASDLDCHSDICTSLLAETAMNEWTVAATCTHFPNTWSLRQYANMIRVLRRQLTSKCALPHVNRSTRILFDDILIDARRGHFFSSPAAFAVCKMLCGGRISQDTPDQMEASHAQLLAIIVQQRVALWRDHRQVLDARLPPAKLTHPSQLFMVLQWQKSAQCRLLRCRTPASELHEQCVQTVLERLMLLHLWAPELDVIATASLLVPDLIDGNVKQRIVTKIEWLQKMWISVASSWGFDLESTLSEATEAGETEPVLPMCIQEPLPMEDREPGDVHDVLPWLQKQLAGQVTLYLATCNFTPTADNAEQGCIALVQGDVVKVVADDSEGTGWCCIQRLVREHHLYKEQSIESKPGVPEADDDEEGEDTSFTTNNENESVEGWVPLSFLKPIVIPLR